MKKIYVAANDVPRAQGVMNTLKENGHAITFDWTIGIENEPDQNADKAIAEREGIRESDVLVYLWADNQESARYEAGMAMGLGKHVIVSGNHQSFFFQLPEVISVSDDNEIVSALSKLK